MADSNNTIEQLIAGGLLGAAIGAILSKEDKEEGAFIGALLGAAITSTLKANEESKKTNIPLIVEENGKLYEMTASGEKKFIKEIKKQNVKIPERFKLK